MPYEVTAAGEAFIVKLRQLAPQTDEQRSIKDRAIQVSDSIAHTRWLLFTQSASDPDAVSYSLDLLDKYYLCEPQLVRGPQADRGGRIVCLCAIGCGSDFLVLELGQPFSGNNANFEYTSTQRTGAAVIRLRRNCAGARGL